MIYSYFYAPLYLCATWMLGAQTTRAIRSLETMLTGGCDLPGNHSEIQTQVLQK